MTRRTPLDPDLYATVVEEAKARFAVWPSAYASGWVVKTYKARGGRYAGQGRKESTGLTKWFGEEWVDLSRPTADGSYEPCGRKRSDAPFDAAQYPKCRPLKEALRMSPDEVKDAIKRKRAAEAKAGRGAKGRGGRGARAPVRVSTYRKNPDPTHERPRAQWFHGGSVEDARQVKALGHFPAEYAPRLGNYGAGVYLTSNKEEARRFGDVVIGASVDPSVRLLDLRDPTYRAMPSSVFDHLTSPQAKAAFEERWNASDLPGAVVEGATADGYGGVIWTGDDWNDWAVVFDPTQVRAEAGAPGRGSRARAPKRVATYRANPLADLPVVDTEEWDDGTVVEFVAVPFPYERKPLAYRDDPTARGPVHLADLIATQRRVTKAGVMGAGDAPITVLQTTDGRRYITDGHHRAVAAWLRGDDTIPAVVRFVRE